MARFDTHIGKSAYSGEAFETLVASDRLRKGAQLRQALTWEKRGDAVWSWRYPGPMRVFCGMEPLCRSSSTGPGGARSDAEAGTQKGEYYHAGCHPESKAGGSTSQRPRSGDRWYGDARAAGHRQRGYTGSSGITGG